jgi:hypothetical protein
MNELEIINNIIKDGYYSNGVERITLDQVVNSALSHKNIRFAIKAMYKGDTAKTLSLLQITTTNEMFEAVTDFLEGKELCELQKKICQK